MNLFYRRHIGPWYAVKHETYLQLLPFPQNCKQTPTSHQISTLGSLTVYIVVHPSYQSRQYRLFRLSVFILTGLSAFAPIIHASRLFPLEQLNKQSGLPYYYAEGGIILLGALIYGTRFPEKLCPGRFDIRRSSHQNFHVLVVLVTSIHLLGVLNALGWNDKNPRCRTGDRLL